MTTITEMIRNNLYDRLDIRDDVQDDLEVYEDAKKMIDSLNNLVKLAKPRLLVGAIRYGANKRDYKEVMEFIDKKLKKYKDTGNSELLVDILNWCAIEFALQTHPNFHFKAEDR
jgi:hypothetical protein